MNGNEKTRVVIGLDSKRLLTESQAHSLREHVAQFMPDVEALFVQGASFASWEGSNADDLIVAATRMHDALYREGEWLNGAPEEVASAFGQLQAALKRRGWTP